MDHDSYVLTERVERLERSNRRLKLLSFLVFVAIGTMGAAQGITHTFGVLNAKQINAEGISLIDANGRLRIALGADPASEQAGMVVIDLNGIIRNSLGVASNNTSGFSADGTNGVPRAAIGTAPDNSSGFSAFDDSGITRVAAGDANGSSFVQTFASNGIIRGSFSTDSFASGAYIFDADGNLRTDIFSHAILSGFEVRTPSEVPVIGISSNPDGTSQNLAITGPNGTGGAGMNVNSGPGGINQGEFVGISAADGTRLASMDSALSGDGEVKTFFASGTQSGHLP